MKKKDKKTKHFKDWANNFLIILTVLFVIFAIISLCFYANRIGKMKFKDIIHFWDYISSENKDWDTFSFLLSGAIGCAFSGITLLFVIVQYYNGVKEKKEIEIEKRREEIKNYFEKSKLEQEKRHEKYLHEKEQEKIEKDKLTVRYIEDMEKLNKQLFEKFHSDIYEELNIQIEESIYLWLLVKSVEKTNFSSFNVYKQLKKALLITKDPFDSPIGWDDFIKYRDTDSLYRILTQKLILSNDIRVEILENLGSLFSTEIFRIINDDVVNQIIYNNSDKTLKNLLKMIIEHFIFAMTSLDDYKTGINYYFLQLSSEQRFFFAFIAKDEEIIRIVMDAIEQTNILDEKKYYSILKLMKKIN